MRYPLKRLLSIVALVALLAIPAAVHAKLGFMIGGVNVQPAPTINGVALSNGTTFTTPAAANSTIGTLSASCSGNCSGATFALSTSSNSPGCSSATNNGSFAISGSNFNIGGSQITGSPTEHVGIQVTLAGATNSGACYPITLTGQAQTISSVTATPNPGVCQTGAANACTALSVTMNPQNPAFSGTFAISTSGCTGSDFDTNFSVNSTTGAVAISNTSVAAGNYTPCVTLTETGIGNSPYYQTVSITVTAPVSANFVANVGTTYQTIDGFGGSDAFSGPNTFPTSVYDLLFCMTATSPCAQQGIGLNLFRVAGGDTSTTNKLAASARGSITFFMDPWSVDPGGNYASEASNLVSYPVAMTNAGVPISYMGTQNEPDCGCNGGFVWSPSQLVSFIDGGFATDLANANIKLEAPVTCCGQTSGVSNFSNYITPIESDSTANAAVSLFTYHQYNGTPAQNGYTHDNTRHVWQTEVYNSATLDYSIAAGITQAEMVYDSIVGDKDSGWVIWQFDDYNSDNANTGLFYNDSPEKGLFTLGNFSRYVRPGWKMVGVTGSLTGMYGVGAFVSPSGPSGGFAIIAVNGSGSTLTNVTFGISGGNISGTVTPYVTSGTAIGAVGTDGNLSIGSSSSGIPTSITPSGNVFTSNVPYGVVTFVGQTTGGSQPTITGITLNGGSTGSYTSGATSGTNVGPIAVTMSDSSTFDGTLATSTGAPGTYFSISSSNLQTNSSTPTCTSSTPYTFNIVATPGSGETGANFTKSVTVTCNPTGGSGVACTFGPNAPSVPSAAQAAGFTTCVANYDFTNTASFTNNGHTYQWSNMGTWLDCDGASNPLWTFAYGNCSHVNIISDGGTQTLDVQWQPSDYGTYTSTAIQTGGPGNDSNISNAILSVPTGKYVEVVSRITQSTQSSACNSGCTYAGIWSWGGNGNPNFIEWDFIEYYYNGVNSDGAQLHPTDGASASVDAIGEPHNVSGYNPTQYNTFGIRTASDTSGDLAMCTYLNGTLINGGGAHPCGTGSYSPVPVGRNFLVMTVGPQGSAPNFLANADVYVQRETVWSCSGWATGECYNSSTQVANGGVLTNAP